MGGMDCYEKDFEDSLLQETCAYYKRKAAEWIEQVRVVAAARGLATAGKAARGLA